MTPIEEGGCESSLRDKLLLRTHEDLALMRSALDRGDFGTIVHKAHRLAGAAGALGFEALGVIGRALEREANRADAAAARLGLQSLASELERVAARRAG